MVHSAAIVSDFVDSSAQLTDLLRKNDFVTRFITFRDEEKILASLKDPVVFIQFSDQKELVQQRIKDLIHKGQENPTYSKHKIVVLGPEISFFHDLISGFFPKIACVNTPFNEITLRRALDVIFSIPEIEVKSLPSRYLNLFDSENVFKQIQEKELGGKDYINSFGPDDIKDKGYLSEREDVSKQLKSIEKQADEWEIGHMHRTAHLAFLILNTLGLNPKGNESFLIASNLYCKNLLQDPHFTRSDPLANLELRNSIAANLLKCAAEVEATTKNQASAEIIRHMSYLFSADKKNYDESDVSLITEAIIGADLFDRACWQSGVWEPSSAHKILVKVRDNILFELSTDITACLIKYALEAIEATHPKRTLSVSVARNIALEELSDSIESSALGNKEKLVQLSQLSPGMILKKPVMAFDGKMVVPKEIVLDTDIIWRLWCLSAVRPINTPFHVFIP